MASIFRPFYSSTGPKGEKVKRRLRKWYVEYRDGDGILRRVRGFTDKEATRQLAAQLEREAAQKASGLIDKFVEPRRRPLSEHVADYELYLKSKGDTPKHVRITMARIRACFEGGGFTRISDLDANRVVAWLAEQRGKGLSARTSNFYLTCVRGFARWLQRSQRIPDNPFLHLQGVNPRVDIRRERRALTAEELQRLFDAARNGPVFRGLSGTDREMLYLTAAYTGLRASELASLRSESLDFTASPARVKVEAAYSKHRREDLLPLHPELARRLQVWLKGRQSATERLWPGTWIERSGMMIRADLEAAGVPYEAADGVADLHALRHTFLSNLARSGAHPKTIQELARHSTITLTMDRYSHLGLMDLSKALDALAVPPEGEPKGTDQEAVPDEARATGTDGPHAGPHAGTPCMRGPELSQPVPKAAESEGTARRRNSRRGQELATPGKRGPRKAMVSPAWLEQATCGLGNRQRRSVNPR